MRIRQTTSLRQVKPAPRSLQFSPRFRINEVLAIAPHGLDVNALLARGFKLETMADIVRSEFATVAAVLRAP